MQPEDPVSPEDIAGEPQGGAQADAGRAPAAGALPLKVVGLGLHLPPRVETADDLAPRVGRSADWIRSRTGVDRRRVSDESMAAMAAKAARAALGDGPPPDLVMNASLTPMQLIPDSSVFVMRELGLQGIPSFSVHATCLSFLVATQNAAALLAAGAYRRILVVSAEQGSVCRDWEEPESAVLIGDGAAAAVLERPPAGEASALLGHRMRTFPEGAAFAEIRGCGTRHHPNDPATRPADNLFQMNGPRIYRLAVRKVARLVDELLAQVGLRPDDIDLVVPHQASGPALSVIPRYGFPADRVVDVVGEYGNCIAASMPMALAAAAAQGRLRRGDRVLLLGTGAGVSVAGAVLRW